MLVQIKTKPTYYIISQWMATAKSYFTSFVFLHPVLYDSSSQLSKMQQKRIDYKTWMSALLACFPIEFRIQWHPNNKRWGCKPNQLHLKWFWFYNYYTTYNNPFCLLTFCSVSPCCPSPWALPQRHGIMSDSFQLLHPSQMAYSGSCRYAARKRDYLFLQNVFSRKQLKMGQHHFQLRCTPWQLQLYPPRWLPLDDVRLTSMLFSQISCIVRRTHRWNFSKGNLDKAWNYHDTAFQQAAVISAGNIQLPRVQVSKHYNHPWNCVKDNFLCPHIHTSASFPATLFALRISSLLSPPGAPPPGSNVLIGVTFPLRPQANGTVQVLQLVITDS